MSRAYALKFGRQKINRVKMREHLHIEFPPGLTEQSHAKECDINNIIKKFNKTGLFSHTAKIEGRYGDMTGADFKTMQDIVAGVESQFNALPSEIRNRFNNDSAQMLSFYEDPANREEAIKIGLIRGDSDPNQDGLGEHVPEPVEPPAEPPVEPPAEPPAE